MKKPIIGITSNYSSDDITYVKQGLGAIGQDWSLIANDYARAVIKAGGIPLIIPVIDNEEYIKDLVNTIDGLLLSGGGDIDPMITNQRMIPEIGIISPERDNQELLLLDLFYKNTNKPILGICRGLQLINVYFKGDLILDIPKAGYPSHSIKNNKKYNPVHSVTIAENTLTKEILNENITYVNSYHHQAAGKIGENLIITAKSEDGIIEALELNNAKERFLLATQWHPEMMAEKHENQQKIFNLFITKAKSILS